MINIAVPNVKVETLKGVEAIIYVIGAGKSSPEAVFSAICRLVTQIINDSTEGLSVETPSTPGARCGLFIVQAMLQRAAMMEVPNEDKLILLKWAAEAIRAGGDP